MTKNPLYNALAAFGYIILVASVMNFLSSRVSDNQPFIAPVLFLSMFTLSAAVMGYIFVFTPGQLYLDGKKKEGLSLFLRTVASFAGITAILLTLVLSGIIGK